MKKILVTLAVTALAVTILMDPKTYMTCVKDALTNCYTTLIPSLMTFMTLSCLICETFVGDTLARLISPIVKRLFHLNKNCGKIILMSLIGGYPCGAKMISNALKKEEIDPDTAQRLMCFCVNASPAYVISAVGVGLYADASLGAILYGVHALTALFIGILVRPKKISPDTPAKSLPFSTALVKAVGDSTNAMLMICAFSLAFSVVLTFLETAGIFNLNSVFSALVAMSLDVVTGVSYSAKISIALTASAVSLGGMSIFFQCMAMLKDEKINFLKILPFRFLHSLLTGCVSYFIIKIKYSSVETAINLTPSLSGHNVWMSVVFVGCCVFFLLTLRQKTRSK